MKRRERVDKVKKMVNKRENNNVPSVQYIWLELAEEFALKKQSALILQHKNDNMNTHRNVPVSYSFTSTPRLASAVSINSSPAPIKWEHCWKIDIKAPTTVENSKSSVNNGARADTHQIIKVRISKMTTLIRIEEKNVRRWAKIKTE